MKKRNLKQQEKTHDRTKNENKTIEYSHLWYPLPVFKCSAAAAAIADDKTVTFAALWLLDWKAAAAAAAAAAAEIGTLP